MILEAAKKYNIALRESVFIGDALSDEQAGKKAGLKTFLIPPDSSFFYIIQQIVQQDG